jgi:hypothetical protein
MLLRRVNTSSRHAPTRAEIGIDLVPLYKALGGGGVASDSSSERDAPPDLWTGALIPSALPRWTASGNGGGRARSLPTRQCHLLGNQSTWASSRAEAVGRRPPRLRSSAAW